MTHTTAPHIIFADPSGATLVNAGEQTLLHALEAYRQVASSLSQVAQKPEAETGHLGTQNEVEDAMVITQATLINALETVSEQRLNQMDLSSHDKRELIALKRRQELQRATSQDPHTRQR